MSPVQSYQGVHANVVELMRISTASTLKASTSIDRKLQTYTFSLSLSLSLSLTHTHTHTDF